MVIAGMLLILAVALDAARRIHSERYSRSRAKAPSEAQREPEEAASREDEQLFWPRELPNGRARVVPRGQAGRSGSSRTLEAGDEDTADGQRVAPSRPATDYNGATRHRKRLPERDAARVQDRNDPVTDQTSESPAGNDSGGEDNVTLVTGITASDATSDATRSRKKPAVSEHSEEARKPKKTSSRRATGKRAVKAFEPEVVEPGADTDPGSETPEVEAGEELVPQNLDWLEDIAGEERRALWAGDDGPAGAGGLPRGVEPEAFMLNVVSRSPEGFSGEDILHILLACDLRFGDMDFFHRHEQEAGRGAIQFSVANMMQPGVFDLDAMADFRTPGLVFFVTLPGPDDMMKAFNYMLETAQVVARNLGGDVLDESRSVVTQQTLDHSRQKIRDLERRLLARASG